jgi:hypothetical protein
LPAGRERSDGNLVGVGMAVRVRKVDADRHFGNRQPCVVLNEIWEVVEIARQVAPTRETSRSMYGDWRSRPKD